MATIRPDPISAGQYQLHLDHDRTGIPAAGATAFVHVPRFKGNLQTGNTSTCDDPNNGNYPLFAFTAPDGTFVVEDDGKVITSSTPDDAFGGWAFKTAKRRYRALFMDA
jgi:hypothetical protein